MKCVNPSPHSGWHDPRKVLGIREESEDARKREGHPFLELQFREAHARSVIRRNVLLRPGDNRPPRLNSRFCTGESAPGAECKENVSE